MDDVTTVQVHGLSEPEALGQIITFAQRFGPLHADLAAHAAFPLVLTPDLLYRIWASFLPQTPWTTVSDILLSSLCREVGHELYEMDPAIRNILLGELREDSRFGETRLKELAGFLEEYIKLNLQGEEADQRHLAEAQRLTALAHTAPDEAAREIASKLSDPSRLKGAELLRIATLTETLSEQLREYSSLVHYSRGVERLAHGDQEAASSLLNRAFAGKQDVEIAGVTLQRPRGAPEVRQAQVEETISPPAVEEAGALGAPRIFISYRRADSKYVVDRIRDRLMAAFGEGSVLRDLEDIPAGVDFRTTLENEIQSCNVLLVVIGPRWADITDPQGRRRLSDPDDIVRMEVEAGLRTGKMIVIPVTVMNASLPVKYALPESMEDLLNWQALSIRNDPDFGNDVEGLIQDIRRLRGPIEPSRQVFISYAWGSESEEIVNQMDNALQQRGIKIIRDKRDLGYKGSIREFMEGIGRGSCVIVAISDKYLRSPNCMFELVEISDGKQFHDRIFPVVLNDANIYDPVKRIEYVRYWEAKQAELVEAMKTLDPANLQGIREDMDLYDRIRNRISGLTGTLKDMNTLTPDMHRDSDFSVLYAAVEKRLSDVIAEEPLPRKQAPQAVTVDKQVYFSYAWGGQSERIVNELDADLQSKGIMIIRGKRDSGSQGTIRDFIRRIGHGSAVIVVINDEYLRSPNCMVDWVEIAENRAGYDRIFPIVLADADIYDPINRINYIKYWEDKRRELMEAMKNVDPANLRGIHEDMDLYDRIRDRISGLTSTLKDMNTLTPDMHRDSDFSDLYTAIEKRLSEGIAEETLPQKHVPAAAPAAEQPGQKAKIFISHRVAPRELAEFLAERLSDLGYSVFIDIQSIRAGEGWTQQIAQGIETSDFVVVLLSEASVESAQIRKEIELAEDYRLENGKPRILPVRVAYEKELPESISAFLDPGQTLTWSSEFDNERLVQELVQAMQGELAVKEPLETSRVAAADELYDQLASEDQVTMRRILLRLVRPGEGLEVTSNRVSRRLLHQAAEATDRIDRVLYALIEARLLLVSTGDSDSEQQVEIADEALIRDWPRLVAWLEEERVRLRQRRRLTAAAEEWQRLNRDASVLWQGPSLDEAFSYDDLTVLEAEFLEASQAAASVAEQAEQRVGISSSYEHNVAPAQVTSLKTLVIVYDPVVDVKSGKKLSEYMRWNRVEDLAQGFMTDILQTSGGLARYQIIQRIDVEGFFPKVDGYLYDVKTYLDVIRGVARPYMPQEADYYAIIERFNILQRIAQHEIDEVWIFHFPHAGLYSSIMGGPGAFWCNAPPLRNTESAGRRFVIMGFSFERGIGEMLNNMGYRAESILEKTFEGLKGDDNLWKRFIRYEKTAPGRAAVGTIQFAPNSQREFDWNNPSTVLSECDDWLRNFPNFKGEIRPVTSGEWGSGDIREHHKWWFNHLPRVAGSENGIAHNWWQYVMDPNHVRHGRVEPF